MNVIPEAIQSQLEPDEQVLWWERPRIHLSVRMALLNSIVAIILYGVAFWVMIAILHNIVSSPMEIAWQGLISLGIIGLLSFLRIFLKTWNTFFWQSPPYRRHTFYAITSQKALIMLHIPSKKPLIFRYFPSEISTPSLRKLTSRAYILTFAASQQARIGNIGAFFTLPGSFYSIRNPQKVSALLEQLRIQTAPIAPDPV